VVGGEPEEERRRGDREGAGERSENNAQLVSARSAVEKAELDLKRTQVVAPGGGMVTDLKTDVGQFAQAGTRLMSLVPLDKIYVTANFKETQLALMRAGQPATIEVDALGGTELHGHVESVSPGTGGQFSLLPPQNATGNFTKIVQRIPVRIAIDAGQETRQLLVPGMSADVTVDTRSAKGTVQRIKDEQERHNERRAR
jgi:membrane fusion protein (multidrug efflux system)